MTTEPIIKTISKSFFAATVIVTFLMVGLNACAEISSTPVSQNVTMGLSATNSVVAKSVPATIPTTIVSSSSSAVTTQAAIISTPPIVNTNITGRYYWVDDDTKNIWGGGVGLGDPITEKSLGGELLLRNFASDYISDLAISPDGSKLVYSHAPINDSTTGKHSDWLDINIFDLVTRKADILIKHSAANEFLEYRAWASDGQSIYFSTRINKRATNGDFVYEKSIEHYDLKSQQRKFLLKNSTQPMPTPDDKKLVYIGISSDKSGSLQVLDLLTKQSLPISSPTQKDKNIYAYTLSPTLSPDGKTVVFWNDIFIPDPGEPTSTSNGGVNHLRGLSSFGLVGGNNLFQSSSPSTSPLLHQHTCNVFAVNIDGSNLHPLATLPFFAQVDVSLAWSKDSQQVLIAMNQSTVEGVFMVNADGGSYLKKSDKGANYFVWQSDYK